MLLIFFYFLTSNNGGLTIKHKFPKTNLEHQSLQSWNQPKNEEYNFRANSAVFFDFMKREIIGLQIINELSENLSQQ